MGSEVHDPILIDRMLLKKVSIEFSAENRICFMTKECRYRLNFLSRLWKWLECGQQMLVVAIDWELYARTGSALPLAFVGLSQMIPMILCTIPAGHFADKFNRKKIILIATLVLAAASLGLTLSSAFLSNVMWIYFFLVVIGAARTFLWPASAAFVTSLVPRSQFARAVTFNSGAFQFSSVVGPVAFGLVVALTPHAVEHNTAWSVYALNVLASIACFALVVPIKHIHKERSAEPVSAKSLIEGFRFVYQNKIILGTITLDLFAVLLGGAVTILPIFAENIFHVGAGGYGWLRYAMPMGAVICMAKRSLISHNGAASCLHGSITWTSRHGGPG